MITKELLEYVRTQINAGVEKSKIKKMLMAGGDWESEEVDRAFDAILHSGASTLSAASTTPATLASTPSPAQLSQAAPAINRELGTYAAPRIKKSRKWIWRTLTTLFVLAALLFGWREYQAFRAAVTPRQQSRPAAFIPVEWRVFDDRTVASFKYPLDWAAQTPAPIEAENLDAAIEEYVSTWSAFGSHWSAQDVSVPNAPAKVIFPEPTVAKAPSGQTILGTLVVQLPRPIVSPFSDTSAQYAWIQFATLPDITSTVTAVNAETFRLIMNSLIFAPAPSVAEQKKALGLCEDVRENKKAPTFEEYPVTVYAGKRAPLDMSSDLAKNYKTALSNALKTPISFGGKYVRAEWGCGSGCPVTAFVDVVTGKPIETTWSFVETKPNSALIIEDMSVIGPDSLPRTNKHYFHLTETGEVEKICSEIVPNFEYIPEQ